MEKHLLANTFFHSDEYLFSNEASWKKSEPFGILVYSQCCLVLIINGIIQDFSLCEKLFHFFLNILINFDYGVRNLARDKQVSERWVCKLLWFRRIADDLDELARPFRSLLFDQQRLLLAKSEGEATKKHSGCFLHQHFNNEINR